MDNKKEKDTEMDKDTTEKETSASSENEAVKEALENFRGLLANAYRPEDQPPIETWPKKKDVPDDSDVEMNEGFDSLFEGQELSEEFKLKVSTIFEAKVHERVSHLKEQIQEAAEAAIADTVEKAKCDMEEAVDNYLSYVATQFMKENELAVTEGLRYEIAESFMEGLKSLFMEHNVEIPEEKVDLVSVMEAKIADLETVLNEAAEKFVSQQKELTQLKEQALFAKLTENLADTEKDKIAKLAESIEFTDEETYSKRLGILIETFSKASSAPGKETAQPLNEETTNPSDVRSPGKFYAEYMKKNRPNSF